MRLDGYGRGPLNWRRRRRSGPHYEYPPGYGRAQAARRARFRRGLWWSTLVVATMVGLCCAGVVVSQIGFGGATRPGPSHSTHR